MVQDRYVTRDCVHAWQAARPEIDVRWLDGGHVTGALCGFPTVRHCILQAIPQHETA